MSDVPRHAPACGHDQRRFTFWAIGHPAADHTGAPPPPWRGQSFQRRYADTACADTCPDVSRGTRCLWTRSKVLHLIGPSDILRRMRLDSGTRRHTSSRRATLDSPVVELSRDTLRAGQFRSGSRGCNQPRLVTIHIKVRYSILNLGR